MGLNHKYRNIPTELSQQYEGHISRGLTRKDALDCVFGSLSDRLDRLSAEIQESGKAAGTFTVKAYEKYKDDNKVDASLAEVDRLDKSLIKLGVLIAAHTASSRSREAMVTRVRSLLEQIDPDTSVDFLEELKGITDSIPNKSSFGLDLTHRLTRIREVVDEAFQTTQPQGQGR